MITASILTILVSTFIVATLGFSLLQKNIEDIFLDGGSPASPSDTYFLRPALCAWGFISEFTLEMYYWLKMGVMCFLSEDYRDKVAMEGGIEYLQEPVEEDEDIK